MLGFLLLGACGAPGPASPVQSLPSSAVIAEAIRFRTELGLRADEAWIRAVEANPLGSAEEFGVRLLPHERADLHARARNAEAVAPIIRAYGRENPASFAGVYIDQQAGGMVVGLFTADITIHEVALRARFHPDARWAIRPARFTVAALEELHSRLIADQDWFDAAGISLRSIDTDMPNNRVVVVYFSVDPAASDLIRTRFDAGEMLAPILDPQPVALLPRGSLRGRVVDSVGEPVPGLLIEAIGDIADAEPDGGVAYETEVDGSFFIPRLAAMGWEVRALVLVPDDGWKAVGSTRVVVAADATAFVQITVPRVAPVGHSRPRPHQFRARVSDRWVWSWLAGV